MFIYDSPDKSQCIPFPVLNRVQLSTPNLHENPKCSLNERVLQYFPGNAKSHVHLLKDKI